MKVDTPLPEVAALLGTETAQILLCQPVDIQWHCLELVRAYIVELEAQNITFDPILLQEAVGIVVTEELDLLKGGA